MGLCSLEKLCPFSPDPQKPLVGLNSVIFYEGGSDFAQLFFMMLDESECFMDCQYGIAFKGQGRRIWVYLLWCRILILPKV